MATKFNLITRESYEEDAAVNTYDNEELKSTEKIIFDRYLTSGSKVLDIGCGVGRTSINLYHLGCQVTAIDYSANMIKRAVNKYHKFPIKFLDMNAKELKFKDNNFDFCFFSFNGLDYLYPEKDRIIALKEIFRVLKPGGYFAFSSHNSMFIPNTPTRFKSFLQTAIRGQIIPYRWDFQEFGPVITHVISPMAQLKQLTKVGFRDPEVVSKYSKIITVITFTDPYPSYVCRK